MKLEDVKLGLGMPHTDRYYMVEFVHSFFLLERNIDLTYLVPSLCGPTDVLRNHLVRAASSQKCTHLWMADTDQIYPQNTLTRLLERSIEGDLDAVTAKVHRRYPPYDPIMFRGEHPAFKNVPDEEWKKGGLIEVDATGCGSILYNMRVFEKIPFPWFEFKLEEGPPLGEDIYFCVKMREAGFRIFVDCDLKVGHLATLPITEESYWAYKFARD